MYSIIIFMYIEPFTFWRFERTKCQLSGKILWRNGSCLRGRRCAPPQKQLFLKKIIIDYLSAFRVYRRFVSVAGERYRRATECTLSYPTCNWWCRLEVPRRPSSYGDHERISRTDWTFSQFNLVVRYHILISCLPWRTYMLYLNTHVRDYTNVFNNIYLCRPVHLLYRYDGRRLSPYHTVIFFSAAIYYVLQLT